MITIAILAVRVVVTITVAQEDTWAVVVPVHIHPTCPQDIFAVVPRVAVAEEAVVELIQVMATKQTVGGQTKTTVGITTDNVRHPVQILSAP